MPQLSPPRVKLVPRSLLFGGRRALVIFGSEDALEVGAGVPTFEAIPFLTAWGRQTSRPACHQAFPKSALQL